VTFALRLSINNEDQTMGSVIVTGTMEEAKKKASVLVDKAATRMTYAYGLPVKTLYEFYFRKLEPKTDKELRSWGYHEYLTSVRSTFHIGDYHMAIERTDGLLSYIKQEKIHVIEKALGYYREAENAINPFIKLITFFSSASAIVRDEQQRKVQAKELLKALNPEAANMNNNEFNDLYYKFYGEDKGRSAADHGHIGIQDPKLRDEAEVKAARLRNWTRKLIMKYIEQNQRSVLS
jgi:hypothetical protein